MAHSPKRVTISNNVWPRQQVLLEKLTQQTGGLACRDKPGVIFIEFKSGDTWYRTCVSTARVIKAMAGPLWQHAYELSQAAKRKRRRERTNGGWTHTSKGSFRVLTVGKVKSRKSKKALA